jgi:hypothetical protein
MCRRLKTVWRALTARRRPCSLDHVVDLCCTKAKYCMCPTRLSEILEIMSVTLTILRDFTRANYGAVNRPEFRQWHEREVPPRLANVGYRP